MFNDLLALLEKRSLVLTLSALPEKRIRVTVTPSEIGRGQKACHRASGGRGDRG
jgi:hypothetical protein